ncbi:MAG TPA: hypothetical protein VGZ29_17280 [Terriglobia bacterium]|nr:hypothetical protein [Terriglobia bacterium]
MAIKSVTRAIGLSLVVLAVSTIGLFAGNARQGGQNAPGDRGSDHRSGFGRPESITGKISLVKPDEGLLVVQEQGAGHSTNVSGAATITQNPNGSTTTKDTDVSASPGPAEPEYHFRVTANTLIRINGQRTTLNDLAGMQNKQATVHFVPERNGNFAKGIEVGP